MDDRFPRKHAAPAVDERATQRPGVEPDGDLVRKTGENATLDGAGFGFSGADIQLFVACSGQELFRQLSRFASRACVDPEARATLPIEAAILRVTKRVDQDEKVGFGFTPENVVTIFPRLFAIESTKKGAPLSEGSY